MTVIRTSSCPCPSSAPALCLLGLVLFPAIGCAGAKEASIAEPPLFAPSISLPKRLPPSLLASPDEGANEPSTDAFAAPSPRPTVTEAPPPSWPKQSRSEPLLALAGFWNPMPGGVLAGYRADTGLDIMGVKKPVFAMASGKIDYAEWGHTLWTGPRDTAYCVRIELDEPIPYKDRKVTHLYYAHLSELLLTQAEGAKPRAHIDAGDQIGVSGVANGSYHLHIGFLLDGEVRQYWGTFLYEDEIREVMGGYRKGFRLPAQ